MNAHAPSMDPTLVRLILARGSASAERRRPGAAPAAQSVPAEAKHPRRCPAVDVTTARPASDTAALDRLWTDLLDVKQAIRDVGRQQDEAEALMPWWAANGFTYLPAKGQPENERHSANPAILGLAKPMSAGSVVLARPSLQEIDRRYVQAKRWGHVDRAEASRGRALAEFETRWKAQEAERAKVGLRDPDAVYEPLNVQVDEIEAGIRALPQSLERLGALLLIETIAQGCRTDRVEHGHDSGATLAMRELRPFIRGAVLAAIEDHLSRPGREYGRSPLWGSYWPDGVEPEVYPYRLWTYGGARLMAVREEFGRSEVIPSPWVRA